MAANSPKMSTGQLGKKLECNGDVHMAHSINNSRRCQTVLQAKAGKMQLALPSHMQAAIPTSNKPQMPPVNQKNPLSIRPKSKSAQKLSDRKCTGLILIQIYCMFLANDDMLYGV